MLSFLARNFKKTIISILFFPLKILGNQILTLGSHIYIFQENVAYRLVC